MQRIPYRTAGIVLIMVLTGSVSSAVVEPKLDRDTVVFGGSANYPPFEWITARGEPRGFLIDLKNVIAESGGVTARHRLMAWEDTLAALEAGEVDAVPMFASKARSDRFRFTEPVYYLTHGIFGRKNGPVVAQPEQLDGARVAVVEGGYAAERLRSMHPDLQLVEMPTIAAALRAIEEVEVAFAVLARHTARRIVSDDDLEVDQLSRPFWPRRYVFAVRKNDTALYEWLRYYLGLVQANGRYYAIYERWEDELEWTSPTFGEVLKRYAWLFTTLLTLIVLTTFWSGALRRRVRQKTEALEVELARRKTAEEEVRYQAFHDALTGLPSRAEFIRRLDELNDTRPERPVTVVSIGLNGIEDVVVTFGYRVGESLVRAFGRRLEQYGFDVVCHLGTGVYAAAKLGPLNPETMLSKITAPMELEEMEIDPRLSVGIATVETTEHASEELLRRARTALSAAVGNKRPWQVYSPEIEPDRNAIALLRDYWTDGTRDFVAHFQPQVDLATGRVVGAEALVRWQHPRLGLLMPNAFIPLLEKSGLVYRVTEKVIHDSIAFALECRRQGLNVTVSVNVTASDLLEHDLVSIIRKSLDYHGVEAADLRLEMTETGLITEPARVRAVLLGLRDMGIYCAIDDFGTGYSSLSYLSDFPVHSIKLDRVFVSTMLTDPRHRAIVESTIALAHELGLNVVAEGPEDEETLALLRDFRCDYAQGFVFTPAIAPPEFLEFARSHKAP